MSKKNDLSTVLDLAIKASEGGCAGDGYRVGDRTYETYITNAEWARFVEEMPESAKQKFAKGGFEMAEKDGHPPKMACYGSSSRMMYRLAHKVAGMDFEKCLPTSFGGPGAFLDGFRATEDGYLFIEAKCHEPYHAPYGESNPCATSPAYCDLYEYIERETEGALVCRVVSCDDAARKAKVYFESYGQTMEYFDMKQMICHLLGVATGLARGTFDDNLGLDFWYLVYDPTELDMEEPAGERICEIYGKLCEECIDVDFNGLFAVLLRYLRDVKKVGHMTDDAIDACATRLAVTLCNQDLFGILLGEDGN